MKSKELITDKTIDSDSLKIFGHKVFILLAIASGIYVLSLVSTILAVLFFSLFLSILFSPFLDTLNKKRIPDWLGIIFIFLGILFFFFIVLFAIIPIFVEQIILLFSYIGNTFSAWEALYRSGGVNAL